MRAWCFLPFVAAVSLAGCGPSATVGHGTLAGTYTGIMQATGNGHVLYDSLAAEVTVTESTQILVSELTFSSSAFPSFQAIVLSTSDSAVDLDLVGVNSQGNLQAQEVAFTKDSSGSWVLIIQTAGPPATGDTVGSLVQFASYSPSQAPPATAVAAVSYLEQMLPLASGTK